MSICAGITASLALNCLINTRINKSHSMIASLQPSLQRAKDFSCSHDNSWPSLTFTSFSSLQANKTIQYSWVLHFEPKFNLTFMNLQILPDYTCLSYKGSCQSEKSMTSLEMLKNASCLDWLSPFILAYISDPYYATCWPLHHLRQRLNWLELWSVIPVDHQTQNIFSTDNMRHFFGCSLPNQ